MTASPASVPRHVRAVVAAASSAWARMSSATPEWSASSRFCWAAGWPSLAGGAGCGVAWLLGDYVKRDQLGGGTLY